MIEVTDLTKVYVDLPAVDHIHFSVGEGEIVGFLGPNGAGKTTTLRMITGFMPPTEGRVTIGDVDVWAHPTEAKRQLGYLPENVALYPELRVREYLRFRYDLQRGPSSEFKNNLAYVAQRCMIEEVMDTPINNLSKGYRQRVALAGTLIHRPKVLILDEPTVGLDPVQILKIRQLIQELGKDHTILLSTHILPEAENICQRVMIIDKGRILAQDTPENLRRHFTGNPTYTLTLKGEDGDYQSVLSQQPGVTKVEEFQRKPGEISFRIETQKGKDLREDLFRLALKQNWILLGLQESTLSMEDVFVRLTTEEAMPESQEVIE